MKIIITESQLKFIFENTSEINSILDKMSDVGYDNLSNKEKEDLKKYSEWLKTDQKTPFKDQEPSNDSFDLTNDVLSSKKPKPDFSKKLKDGSVVKLYSTFKPKQFKDFTEYLFDVLWDNQEWSGYISVDSNGDLIKTEFGALSDDDIYSSLNEEMGPLYDEFEKWIEFEVVTDL